MGKFHRRAAGLLFLLGACACGSQNTAAQDGAPDAGPDVASPACTRPALDADWLKPFVTDVVAQVASAPRGTPTQRAAARAYLAGQLTAMGWEAQTHSYATGANVHTTIPATTGQGKLVVVGAHFDTVPGSPGANDNASGVAAVLAIARYLKDTPCRTAPVSIVFFDEEEVGLLGSRAFARTLAKGDVRAVHTIDQVAWDANGDRRFELEQPAPTLEAEWRAAAAVVGASVVVTTTSGTDHKSFRDLGFEAIGLTEGYVGGDTSPLRHEATDIRASIEPYVDYLVLASKLSAEVILGEVSP